MRIVSKVHGQSFAVYIDFSFLHYIQFGYTFFWMTATLGFNSFKTPKYGINCLEGFSKCETQVFDPCVKFRLKGWELAELHVYMAAVQNFVITISLKRSFIFYDVHVHCRYDCLIPLPSSLTIQMCKDNFCQSTALGSILHSLSFDFTCFRISN